MEVFDAVALMFRIKPKKVGHHFRDGELYWVRFCIIGVDPRLSGLVIVVDDTIELRGGTYIILFH